MKFFAYFLRCNDASLYAGYTSDLELRLKKHNLGLASKYTRTRLPLELVYFEEFPSKSEAMKREIQFKNLTKLEKEELISNSV